MDPITAAVAFVIVVGAATRGYARIKRAEHGVK